MKIGSRPLKKRNHTLEIWKKKFGEIFEQKKIEFVYVTSWSCFFIQVDLAEEGDEGKEF